MKISKYLMLLLLPALAHAQQGSHGGDTRCEEFYQMASKISVGLARIGQDKINQYNPLIDVKAIRSVLTAPLVVIPEHHLSRQAISNPLKLMTFLDVEQWELLSEQKRVDLVTHELLVLTEQEADGEYLISQDALRALRDARVFSELLYKGIKSSENANGSVKFYLTPSINIVTSSSADGVCLYLTGIRSSSSDFKLDTIKFYSYKKKEDEFPIKIDMNGVVAEHVHHFVRYRVISEITCQAK